MPLRKSGLNLRKTGMKKWYRGVYFFYVKCCGIAGKRKCVFGMGRE